MKIKSGGGITSNKFSTARTGKQEPKSHKVSVEATAQLGRSVQFKKPNLERGKGYSPPTGVTDPCKIGPGAGRQSYPSGSQSPTPEAKEMPKGRDTLSEFGRDIPGRK